MACTQWVLCGDDLVQWCWLDHLQDEVLNSPVTPASRLTCTVQVEGAVHAVPWFWFLVGHLCVICCLVRHLAGYTLSIYWFGMRYRTEPLRHGIARWIMIDSLPAPLHSTLVFSPDTLSLSLSLSAGILSLPYCSSHWLHEELACDSGRLQTAWKRRSWAYSTVITYYYSI